MLAAVGPAEAAFPGTNGRIAYESDGRADAEIQSINPDGTRIACTRAEYHRDDMEDYYYYDTHDVHAIDADGTGKVRLSEAGPNEADSSPSWSPDGEEIVFSRSYEAQMPRVFSVDADGVLGEVVFPNASGLEPAWAPDGRRIVYRATPGNALTTVDVTGKATPLGTIGAGPDWYSIPNTRPIVNSPKPAPGSTIRDITPLIGAAVRDRETNLTKANIRLFVDGKARVFSYSAATDELSFQSGALSAGAHTVKVVARDPEGLTTTKSWTFRVAP